MDNYFAREAEIMDILYDLAFLLTLYKDKLKKYI